MAGDWRDLKVLVVGCGSIGKRHARVLREIGVRTLYACDPVPAQAAAASEAARFDAVAATFEDGLALKPDAVVLCTPPAMHVQQAMQAIRAGCHVLTEKPLSADLTGVDDLERLAAGAGRALMVGLCFRYHQGLLKAKRMLDGGRIGRLVSIRALMGEHLPDIRPDYRDLYLARCNGAFELMHDLDLAIWYAGREPSRVHAIHGGFSDIGIEAPDLVELLLEFPDRCTASVHLDFFQLPRRRQIELMGTRGTITVEFASWTECTVSAWDAEGRAWTAERMATDRDDMFRDEDREFLSLAASGGVVVSSLAEGRRSLRVVLQAQGLLPEAR
jgi:predicted dehydrogenase